MSWFSSWFEKKDDGPWNWTEAQKAEWEAKATRLQEEYQVKQQEAELAREHHKALCKRFLEMPPELADWVRAQREAKNPLTYGLNDQTLHGKYGEPVWHGHTAIKDNGMPGEWLEDTVPPEPHPSTIGVFDGQSWYQWRQLERVYNIVFIPDRFKGD